MSSAIASNSPTLQQATKKNTASIKTSKAPKTAKKAPKAPSDHPPYKLMIKKALNELKEKKGASRLAILKFIMANFHLGENPVKINAHLKMALKKGVETGFLKQTKGIGASGSFVLGEGKLGKTTDFTKKAILNKPKAKKAKAPAAKSTGVKKSSPKKKATNNKKIVPEKASPVIIKPAITTPPTATATTPPIVKKTKASKPGNKVASPKKLNVAKKLPTKKKSPKKAKSAKIPKASGGKKQAKKPIAGAPTPGSA
jgi:histone H1/5